MNQTGRGCRELSPEEKGQVDDFPSPSSDQLVRSLWEPAPKCSIFLSGRATLQRCFPEYPSYPSHLAQQQFGFANWQVEGRQDFPGFASQYSAQLVRGMQEPALELSISLAGSLGPWQHYPAYPLHPAHSPRSGPILLSGIQRVDCTSLALSTQP